MSEPLPLNRRHPLYGRNLRHAALAVLDRYGSASIGEILEVLWANDFRLEGERTAIRKRLSDALRHETKRGRAQRVGWGRYAIKQLAATTRWRILRRWDDAGPAERDEQGEPVLTTPAPEDIVAAVPWTKHDRHGDQLWLSNGRHRWRIGRHVRAVIMGRQRNDRLRVALAGAPTPFLRMAVRTSDLSLARLEARGPRRR